MKEQWVLSGQRLAEAKVTISSIAGDLEKDRMEEIKL